MKKNYFQRSYFLWLTGVIFFVGYATVLCLQSYYSQKDLQRSTFKIWSEEVEKKAQLIGFFLQNREADFQRLVNSQPIRSFFDSKDLGMSLEYGLGASLDLINDYFWQLLTQVKVGGLPVYQYLAFMDSHGRPLVEAGHGQLIAPKNFTFSQLLTPNKKGPFFRYWQETGHKDGYLLISAAIFRKGRYRGQVVGRINQWALGQQFLIDQGVQNEGLLFLTLQGHFLCFPPRHRLGSILSPGQSMFSDNQVFMINWTALDRPSQVKNPLSLGRPRQPWIGQSLPISGFASFRLYWLKQGKAVFGAKDPEDLLLGFAGVLILIVLGLFFLFRMTKRNELLQHQLQQAQKMEAVGVLAGGIAHDFNNFLQGMSNINELLQLKSRNNPGIYVYLQKMKELIERASQLVSQLLAFSRRQTPNVQAVDINAEIVELKKFFLRTIPKMIKIETNLEPKVGLIRADPVQIQQIILNLVNNAVDALEEIGKGKISIATFGDKITQPKKGLNLQPGKYICLQVADNGPGMRKEVLEHVFDPFFTTKEVGKGTGLGLAMVYGLVCSHGGEIRCNSALGQGTSFTIWFPKAKPEDLVMEEEEPVQVKPGLGNKSLLVVDDEEVIRETVAEALRDFGFQVLLAPDGESCLELVQREEVDLILLDLGMPGMGGEDCLHKLQAIRPGVPVIVASGYADHKLSRGPEQYGVTAFLKKPYHLDELIKAVEDALAAGPRQ